VLCVCVCVYIRNNAKRTRARPTMMIRTMKSQKVIRSSKSKTTTWTAVKRKKLRRKQRRTLWKMDWGTSPSPMMLRWRRSMDMSRYSKISPLPMLQEVCFSNFPFTQSFPFPLDRCKSHLTVAWRCCKWVSSFVCARSRRLIAPYWTQNWLVVSLHY